MRSSRSFKRAFLPNNKLMSKACIDSLGLTVGKRWFYSGMKLLQPSRSSVMLQQHRVTRSGKLIGLLIACAVLAFCERESQASCGDYVVIGAEAERLALSMRHAAEQPTRECGGPQCGRQSRVPSSPIPPPSRTRLVEQASLLCEPVHIVFAGWESNCCSLTAWPADGHSLAIDRPPQS